MVTKQTWLGIGCGAVAGAFWGLVFLAPAAISHTAWWRRR
jgi:uncharacterized membrane protein